LSLRKFGLVALRGSRGSKLDFAEVKRHASHAARNAMRRRKAAAIHIRFHGPEANHGRSLSLLRVGVSMGLRNNWIVDNSKTWDVLKTITYSSSANG
jgi:hypothetical protein